MCSPKNVRWQFTTSVNPLRRLLLTACLPFRSDHAPLGEWENGGAVAETAVAFSESATIWELAKQHQSKGRHTSVSAQHLNHIYSDAPHYAHPDGRSAADYLKASPGREWPGPRQRTRDGGWQVPATPRLLTAPKSGHCLQSPTGNCLRKVWLRTTPESMQIA